MRFNHLTRVWNHRHYRSGHITLSFLQNPDERSKTGPLRK
jgi:hypothetical protein